MHKDARIFARMDRLTPGDQIRQPSQDPDRGSSGRAGLDTDPIKKLPETGCCRFLPHRSPAAGTIPAIEIRWEIARYFS
jgi:hypothetical protein